jgi:hypothetical protein
MTFRNGTHYARWTTGNAKEDTDPNDAYHPTTKGDSANLRGFQDP